MRILDSRIEKAHRQQVHSHKVKSYLTKKKTLKLLAVAFLTPLVASAQSFNDVPVDYWAYDHIEALYASGITGGCGGGNYCPADPVTRAQMAVFLERAIHGSSFQPPPASGNLFLDVGANDFAAAFIEQLFNEGITGGCGGNNYCPMQEITRAQMAVFLLRARHGSAHSPPPPTGIFDDVDLSHWAVGWIEQLRDEGITTGCSAQDYCPEQNVTRAQMAAFLVRAFGLGQAIPPEVPSGLTVGSATSNSLTLNWTDTSSNATGFRIYRSVSQFGTYGEIATTTGTNFTDTELSASTTYWYKVSAYNDAGESAQIGPASGTTLSPPVTIPSAPTNAVVSNITSNSATLSWTDTSNNESGFEVGYCDGLVSTGILRCSPGLFPNTGVKVIAQVGAGETSYTFTGLSPGTKYSRFVRACNTAGCSANTGSSFTTEAQTASPSIVRIVNDLASNDPWGGYNGLIRIRIGPSMESLYNNNTEQLTPLDSVPYDPVNVSAIPLELLTPGQSLDLDASGFTGEYWIYIEAGWWDLVLDFITFEPLYWQKTPTNVYGCDGSEGYQKWSFIRVYPPFGDPEVIRVSDFLPMYGTWVGHPACP